MAFVEVSIEEDVRRVVAEEISRLLATLSASSAWLTAAGAAEHLATTEEAVRSMVKRRQIPAHRLPNGRLRFDRAELDAWARGGERG